MWHWQATTYIKVEADNAWAPNSNNSTWSISVGGKPVRHDYRDVPQIQSVNNLHEDRGREPTSCTKVTAYVDAELLLDATKTTCLQHYH